MERAVKVKLVRDDINPTESEGRVQPANSRAGMHILLVAKLHEEAAEIADAATDPEEYADLLEVMLRLARLNGVSWASIEEAMIDKRRRRGAFERGCVFVME